MESLFTGYKRRRKKGSPVVFKPQSNCKSKLWIQIQHIIHSTTYPQLFCKPELVNLLEQI